MAKIKDMPEAPPPSPNLLDCDGLGAVALAPPLNPFKVRPNAPTLAVNMAS